MKHAKLIASLEPDHKVECKKSGFVYRLEGPAIAALSAAIASRRPLLVRGEPGVGKSQLARAVSIQMDYRYHSFVVNSRTEDRDLLWTADLVMRLADAQSYGSLASTQAAGTHGLREKLALRNYVLPGPLWWAFDWDYANRQLSDFENRKPPKSKTNSNTSVVLLIDEIDKAESDVPNGLLESLGSGQFRPGGGLPLVKINPKRPPLIIVTTNEERILPDAFVRRCFVLHMALPQEQDTFVKLLVQRGKDHLPRISKDVLNVAAQQLFQDRADALKQGIRPLPGQAEYIDLVRALAALSDNRNGQLNLLEQISKFAFQKSTGIY